MDKKPSQSSVAVSVEFFQILRSFAIRYLAYLREKSSQPQSVDDIEVNISRILNQNDTKEAILVKLLSLQLRGDYHQVIALTLMQDLAKYPTSKSLLQSMIEQSIKLLNSQQQFHTIVPKQNDLLRELLITPYIVTNSSLDGFKTFYRKLKDIKQFYPQTIKEHQKIVFLKTVEQTIEVAAKFEAFKTYEFIFHSIFSQLEILEPEHEFVTSRLKLVKKIVKYLWFFNEDILYKSAFAIMKVIICQTQFSQKVLTLPHLFSSVLNLYEDLLPILVQRISPAPLIIFNHLVINNLQKMLQEKNFNVLPLQILLHSLTQIFKQPFIEYFMKNYDANFMEESVCQSALNILFEFVQNRANQKKPEYEIFKRYLKKAIDSIRVFLNKQEHHIKAPSEKLQKFYEVKRKEYLEIVQDMNEKPKKIFKKLESISNKEIREEIMKKYSRIAKHSTHLEMKKMIDLFAANNPTSEELFGEYVNLLFSNLSKDVNLEEFLRFFSSNFFLNGESQQILRVLDKITVLFYNHQPTSNRILKNSDSTYTFANAIILLNADLHNPQNEEKMSLESFYKICKKINAGEDLPTQMLTQTYTNIKKNKINTFRQKSQMFGISPFNFVLICNKQDQNRLDFFDLEMRMLTNQNFYDFWVYDLLAGIIDERETMKLEQLIERFVYDDNSYECEVIELIRKLVKKKPHIPLHAFEKILEHANFKNARTSEKTISYLWLAVNIIETFPNHLPTNVICELLIFTWRMRSEIKDDMYLRERAEIKRTRRMIRQYQKRQSKKSIMDMFSSFLSSKEEDSEPDVIEEFNMSQTNIKKMNHKVLTQKVVDVLIKSSSGGNGTKPNHRVKAVEFFIGYLRNDQQKIFEEFLSLLYMIFHLLYKLDVSPVKNEEEKGSNVSEFYQSEPQEGSPRKKSNILSSSLNLSSDVKNSEPGSMNQFSETIEDLFYELLGLKESSITKRIENLKKKDVKKYEILQSYCHFWVLKILISSIELKSMTDIEDIDILGSQSKIKDSKKENNRLYLLNKSIEFVHKTDKQIYMDLVYEFEERSFLVFNSAMKKGKSEDEKLKLKDITNSVPEEIVKSKSEEVLNVKENLEQVKMSKHSSAVEPQSQELQKQGQKQAIEDKIEPKIDQTQNSSEKPVENQSHSKPVQSFQPQQEQEDRQHEIIETFIINYRKLIVQFYVNCIRVVGKEDMKKKEWRWLVQLEQMIQEVIESYQDRINNKKQIKTQTNFQKTNQDKNQLSQNRIPLQKIEEIHAKEDICKVQKTKEHPTITENVENQGKSSKLDQNSEDLMDRINKELHQNPSNQQQPETQLLQQKPQQQKVEIIEEKAETKPEQIPENSLESQQNKLQSTALQKENEEKKENQDQPQVLTKVQNKELHVVNNKEEPNLIKEQEEAIKKLMEMYPSGCESSEMLGMPFYML